MRVLLLHPEDACPTSRADGGWDWIVDLGRAPESTYQQWAQASGARVFSLLQYAEGERDVRRVRDLLALGRGGVVDEWGVDWWDVLALMFSQELEEVPLLQRLAQDLPERAELYASRPDPRARALQVTYGAELKIWEGNSHPVHRRLRHYAGVLTQLNATQLQQVLVDRMDPAHALRRRMQRRKQRRQGPAVLLPSAYCNVSRTAVAYAALLPEQKFFLVHARASGKLTGLPENVDSASLDAYFRPARENEMAALLYAWKKLKSLLVPTFPEFVAAEAMGAFARFPALLRWGLAVRDAWNHLFEVEEITACLSADDSNPYSRVPLILAKQRGLPALACHHGALDYRMRVKSPEYADFYLAKGEMEKDYLLRRCALSEEKVQMGAPRVAGPPWRPSASSPSLRPWMVFFTEPYAVFGWRTAEVYRELLPGLLGLAESCGVQLVFKLHPFESVRGHRRLLRNCLPREQADGILVLAGTMTEALWEKARFALTVQSTVALECGERGIPAFLCTWLADAYSGYVEQFLRHGAGHALRSLQDLRRVPELLATAGAARPVSLYQAMPPHVLRGLLTKSRRLAAAVNS
ncbi:MAG: hypothetical protein JST79_08090 [Acidobacteria bacterium]|nr:hypothetical protein [Acidobacteriota bacterium]